MKKYKVLGVTAKDAFHSDEVVNKKIINKVISQRTVNKFRKWNNGTYAGNLLNYSFLELIIKEVK